MKSCSAYWTSVFQSWTTRANHGKILRHFSFGHANDARILETLVLRKSVVLAASGFAQGEFDMMADSVENIQWGLINIGGYTIFHQLMPAQRQHMYAMVRANLTAFRTLGMQGFMNIVKQQNHGVVTESEDSDMGLA